MRTNDSTEAATFDRGTLLLAGTIPVPGAVWDPRVERLRAPACRYRDLPPSVAAGVLAPCDRPPPGSWRPPALRPYQDAALAAWELAERRGVVVLPTGAGKTQVALAAMARTGARSLCLVPTRVLLEQWCARIAEAYSGPLGRFGDGERAPGPVTVATYESAYRHMASLGNRYDLVVVDEAHHAGAGLREEALEMCAAPLALGLTATPPRAEGAAALSRLVGPVVFELSIGDLQGSFLADFELIVLELALSPDEREEYEACTARFREVHAHFRAAMPGASWEEFARAAARSAEGRLALEGFRRARRLLAYPRAKAAAVGALLGRHRDVRTLVFTADNETAYAVARRHLIMPLTCDIPRRERAEALARFRAGELKALVSARVLNEGIDVPDAEVAIVVAGTQGVREHVQRIGRLLRPVEGKKALVYELVARNTTEVSQSRRRRAGLAARTPDPL